MNRFIEEISLGVKDRFGRGYKNDQVLEEKIQEYDEFIGYREVNYREEVLVFWKLIQEPAREYLKKEVNKIKKKAKTDGNGFGRDEEKKKVLNIRKAVSEFNK